MSGKRKKKSSRKRRREQKEAVARTNRQEIAVNLKNPSAAKRTVASEEPGVSEAAAASEEPGVSGTAAALESSGASEEPGFSEELPEKTEKTETAEAEEKGLVCRWKRAGRRQKAIFMAGIAAGLAIISYGGMAWQYQDRLLPGTRINQIACGKMTLEDTEERIRERAEDYELTVVFRGGEEVEISPESMGYRYVPDGGVKQILEEQNSWFWLPAMFSERNYQVAENVDFDRGLLSVFVDQLPQVQEDRMEPPKDARAIYGAGGFSIRPEDEGSLLKTEELKKCLEQAVAAGKSQVFAEAEGLYEEPLLRKENQLLQRQRDQLNQLANASVTYQLAGGETLVLDGNTLKDWMAQDEEGNYYRDEGLYEQKLEEFVREMEARIDDVGSERTFRSTNYGDYSLAGGSYGWILSREKEKERLRGELASGSVIVREPVYKQKGVDTLENGGIGNTYVEIDMSGQHMWFYKDGVCVLDSDVVTGTMVERRYTPEGIYYLYFKQRNRVLRGQILPSTGKPEYETPVSYWMPFNGGIGLHDADWNAYFGGEKYIYSGSHGCVNLPGSVAGELYSLIEVGTPVICYYPEGYSLHG